MDRVEKVCKETVLEARNRDEVRKAELIEKKIRGETDKSSICYK